jgi:glycosyltransferase involved in cell wall biosynthesis
VYQERLLQEEYARWGQDFQGTDEVFIAREQREYVEADCMVASSTFARRSYVEMGVPAARVKTIPQCVRLGRFRKVADPDPDTFSVLFVGQISLRKGIPYLLEAFRRFRHPHKRLILLGSIRPELRPFFRDRRQEHVTVLGRLSREELERLLSRSDVLVLPSIEDGFGMVLAEALACGCPCISSDHTGGPDLYEHGKEGFIVPIRDAGAIALHLEQLAQDRHLRQRMGEAALARVESLGGSHTYGEAWSRLLSAVVEGREPSSLDCTSRGAGESMLRKPSACPQ